MNVRIIDIATAVIILCAPTQSDASDLDLLQGKWTAALTNQAGEVYSKTIEIAKDQLTFTVVGADSKPRLVSKGTAKTTKSAAFEVLSITEIRAGRSEDDLQPVADSRALVYTIRDGALFLASNFDKTRENEKPAVETYVRKEAAAAGDVDAKILGKWKLDLTMGDNAYDYELRLSKPNNRLEAVLVSPRSGEHPCQVVRFKNDELVLEIERDLQGNNVTFVYKGKLTADGLSGKAEVRGREDEFSGTWKASKK